MPGELAERLAELASDMPEAIVGAFVSSLGGRTDPKVALDQIPSSQTRQRMSTVIRLAHEAGFNAKSIGLALQAAFFANQQCRNSQSIELVWTGPSPPQTHLRRTDQALLEVIRNAESEVWIVSFAAYGVQSILKALISAMDRGVVVSLVLESAEESDGKLTFDQIVNLQNSLNHRARVFVWPAEMRQSNNGRSGTLHAKCAVVDGRQLLVSSANLTEAALQVNIELGVLLNSERHALQIQQQLKWLVESSTLRPV
jgi:phosphatidylserine/phosphatidylglycerophosphate/cardiolipin synthase-like enzyme